MDPTAALNILQNHARQKQAELAQTPQQSQAEQSNPTQQTIDMGAPTALPPAPPVVDAAESAAEPEDVDVSGLPAPELLARVRKLQQDRTATYKQYDEALAACAPGEGRQGDPAAYATVVAKVTVVFDRISKRANACEVALRSRGQGAPAPADHFSGLLLFEQSGADEKVCQDAPVGELLQLFRRVGVRHVRRLFEVL